MKKIAAILAVGVLLVGVSFQSMASDDDDKNESKTTMTTSLNGQVVDKDTGEALTGVKLKIKGQEVTTYTDFEGKFKVKGLKPGKYQVETSFISYKEKTCDNISLKLDDKNNVTIKLESLNE
jgi:hypothetical protein